MIKCTIFSLLKCLSSSTSKWSKRRWCRSLSWSWYSMMETLSDRTAQLGSEHTPGWSGTSLAANHFFLGYRLYCIETCGSRVRIPTITSDFQDIEAPIPMGWCVSRTLEMLLSHTRGKTYVATTCWMTTCRQFVRVWDQLPNACYALLLHVRAASMQAVEDFLLHLETYLMLRYEILYCTCTHIIILLRYAIVSPFARIKNIRWWAHA